MNCLNCNSITPTWGGKHKKYCNLTCKYLYEGKVRKRIPLLPIPCKFCKTLFSPRNIRAKFCSGKCKYAFELKQKTNKPETKFCKKCNSEFRPYTSLDKFCSANCRIESMKGKRSRRWNEKSTQLRFGKNNPSFVHGMAARGAKINSAGMRLFHKNRDLYKKELLKNHGYLFCERCGKTNVRFETHHIIYRSEKPKHEFLHDKINLIHLCVPCHNWYHSVKNNRNELVEKRDLTKYFGDDILDKKLNVVFLIEKHNEYLVTTIEKITVQ